jgi:hypothetical protein
LLAFHYSILHFRFGFTFVQSVENIENIQEFDENIIFLYQLNFHKVSHFLSAKFFDYQTDELLGNVVILIFFVILVLHSIFRQKWGDFSKIFQNPFFLFCRSTSGFYFGRVKPTE